MNSLDIGKLIIGNMELTLLFKDSYFDLLDVEKEMKIEFEKLKFSDEFYFSRSKMEFIESFKVNFFTLLILSILKKSGIKWERLIKYGKVIYCLRTIITCTDNLIDNESKGVVFLKRPENQVVNNILLLMVCQNILQTTLVELGDDSGEVSKVILEKIHGGIGGELLQLCIWAPIKLEKSVVLKKFNEGLYDIGMSLQALDDLSDIEEDLSAKKVNLSVSHLIYDYSFEKIDLKINLGNFHGNITEEVRKFLSEYVEKCIEKSLDGFEKLKDGGYPVSRKESLILIKILFKLRGLEQLWEIGSSNIV